MFSNISQKRLMVYLMLAGLLPILIVLITFMSKNGSLSELESSLDYVEQTAFLREQRQSGNMSVRNHYRDADRFYIDKNLETLSFLKPEVESLQQVMNNKNFAGDENVKKRLEFLTGTGNNLIFSEGAVQSFPLFQETQETLIHPIEINASDLQNILAKIEGAEMGPYQPSPNRPQMIILDFKMDKKNTGEKNEVFVLNMKLLKREFL